MIQLLNYTTACLLVLYSFEGGYNPRPLSKPAVPPHILFLFLFLSLYLVL